MVFNRCLEPELLEIVCVGSPPEWGSESFRATLPRRYGFTKWERSKKSARPSFRGPAPGALNLGADLSLRGVVFSYTQPMIGMSRLHRALALTPLFLFCIAALGGCGSDDDGPPPPSLEITDGPVDGSSPLASQAEVSLSVSASHSEGDELTYAWSASCPSLPSSGSFDDASAPSPTWTAPENLSGENQSCTVSVRVSDGEDLEQTRSSTQSVASVPHTLVVTESPSDSVTPVASSAEVNLAASATDSWGHTLTYTWSSDCSSLPTSGSFSDASAQASTWTAPENLSGEDRDCTVSVEISDSEGLVETVSSTQTVASGPVVPEPADPVAFMYNEEIVRTIELELTEERLAFLDADPAAEIYVEGSAIIDGERYDGVGIRYKGSIGAFVFCTDSPNIFIPSGPKTCPKLSMKVKFNEFSPGQRFYGVKRLQFHAMNMDPSMLVERMGYELFRKMGVAAPRTAYVRLVINGAYVGIHLLVEQIDGQFVRSRFSEGGEGNLYKEAWPITDLPDYYLNSLRTNRDEDPVADKMVTFYQDLAADPDAAVLEWLDVDYMMRYFAVDRAINNDDGAHHFYCFDGQLESCANHNFFWYEEVASDRLWLIPWDMDNAAFGNPLNFVAFPGDWRDENPSCVPEHPPIPILPPSLNPACDPIMNALAGYSDLYRERQQELLDGPFSQAVAEQRVDAWADLLRNEVAAAHEIDSVHLAPATWEILVEDFKDSLTTARQALAEDIAEHQP